MEEVLTGMSPFRGSAPFTDNWKHFDVERQDFVATLTFNRPDKLNALTFDTYADLRDLFAELPQRDDTRVLVLRGEGRVVLLRWRRRRDHRCDAGDASRRAAGVHADDRRRCQGDARVPGADRSPQCTARLPAPARCSPWPPTSASSPARRQFAFLFTKVGLAGADMGAAYLLPRLVGLGRATELLMLGDACRRRTPTSTGWSASSSTTTRSTSATHALARASPTGRAQAYAPTKALLSRELDMGLSGALELEAVTQALLMNGDDYRGVPRRLHRQAAATVAGPLNPPGSDLTRTSARSPAGFGRSPRPGCAPIADGASRAGSTATYSRRWVSSGSWRLFPGVRDGRHSREAAAMDLCLLRESLATVSTEAETALALQGLGTYPVLQSGSDDQVDRWVPAVAAGDAVAAFALTEPEAGSDAAALRSRPSRTAVDGG